MSWCRKWHFYGPFLLSKLAGKKHPFSKVLILADAQWAKNVFKASKNLSLTIFGRFWPNVSFSKRDKKSLKSTKRANYHPRFCILRPVDKAF